MKLDSTMIHNSKRLFWGLCLCFASGLASANNVVTIHHDQLATKKNEIQNNINDIEDQLSSIKTPNLPSGNMAAVPSRPNGCIANGTIYKVGNGYSTRSFSSPYGAGASCGTEKITTYTCLSNFTFRTRTESRWVNGSCADG